MADVAAGPGPEGAARWSRDLSDEDQPPVFVPGVSTERIFRARHLLRGRKTEVKMEVPAAAASVPTDAPRRTGEVAGQQMPDKGEIKSASLKDLCPEDKRRIANLIKELARVSEEKEVTEVRLKTEQESFEKKIRQLEEQNEFIIREREALQQQYRECQELLSLYQKYLSEQQEKLTHSLSELEVAKEKEHQMSNHRSLGHPRSHLELDGSYLGIARPQTLYKNNRMACRSPSPKPVGKIYRNCHVGATIHDSRQEETNKFLLENGLHSKCNNTVSPPKARAHSPCRRTAAMDQRRNPCPLQRCFYHKKPGSPDRDSLQEGSHVYKRHSGPCCESFTDYCHSPRTSRLNGSVDLGLKEADCGKKLSEGRRKQLLLQKMELEIEKERLQNLLAKQESKLMLQQQRLQQSRLDYDRCKGRVPNSEELLVDEVLMRAGGAASVMNGCGGGLSSPKHSCGGCLSKTPPASAKGCRASGSSGGNSSGKKSVGFSAHVEDAELWGGAWKEVPRTRREMSPGSRKDAATSPGLTGCRKELVTTATSPIQHDISRYKASLLELVEAMSPKRQHKSCESRSYDRTSQKIPGWRWSPSGARNGGADLEESRILEDIFFI